ncbi:MAG: signal peptidase I [Candidatus Pacearchaeota archaeon]
MKKEYIKKTKDLIKKLKYILWEDTSFRGWIISLIFLFLIVKFVFFPVLHLITGTPLSLVIVESCSMYHKGGIFSEFESWWDRNGVKYDVFQITKEDYKRFPLKNGLDKGDILFVIKANPQKLKKGDIIIFEANKENPIIHRIVKIEERDGKKIFSTLGDNNNGQLFFEKEIDEKIILGKTAFRIVPYFGWIKLIFFEWKKPLSERGFCVEH